MIVIGLFQLKTFYPISTLYSFFPPMKNGDAWLVSREENNPVAEVVLDDGEGADGCQSQLGRPVSLQLF